jgi:hypothetical protein
VRIKTPGQPAMILQRRSTCLLPAALASFALQPAREGAGPARLLAIRQP